MKNLVIITHDDWESYSGGVSRFIREIAPRLSRFFKVTVIVTVWREKEELLSISPTLEIVYLPGFRIPRTSIEVPRLSKKVIQYLEKGDLIFVQTLENLHPYRLALKMKKKTVLFFHSLDWDNVVSSLNMKKLNYLLSPLVKFFWGYWYKKADHICLPSPSFVQYLEREKVDVPYTHVPLGVDVEKFFPISHQKSIRQELGLDPNLIFIGFVGRLFPEKNIDLLFEIFSQIYKKYPQVRLLLIGKGYKKYEQQAQNEAGVVWKGYQENVVPYLQAMDIYCQPLFHTETTSLSTLEAMACGLPVVVNAIGCPKEYIQNEENGFLIDPPNDISQFVHTIERLIRHPELRIKIGVKARESIVNRFSWEETTTILKNLFNETLLSPRVKVPQLISSKNSLSLEGGDF